MQQGHARRECLRMHRLTCTHAVLHWRRFSGYLVLRVMYGVRTAEAMMATPHINQIRMAEFFAEIISEHAGILCASAILSFGRVSGALHGAVSVRQHIATSGMSGACPCHAC